MQVSPAPSSLTILPVIERKHSDGIPGSVAADIETANSVGFQDVVDDAALLIHPTDKTRSVIVTTNKSCGVGDGGLRIYDLPGAPATPPWLID